MLLFIVAGVIGWNQLGVDFDASSPASNKIEAINPPRVLGAFQLIDQQLLGKWSFVFFGYTHCPDVCPTTLTEMSTLANQLGEHTDIQYVFISVDPTRDSPDYLADFVSYFNKQFIGVTGENQQLKQLARQLDITYSLGDSDTKEYVVHHSSAILLIDPMGHYVTRYKAPHYVEVLAEHFQSTKPSRENKT